MYFMHPTNQSRGRAARKGITLLIVIAMLTLFSVVALTFVFYAESQGNAATVATGALTKLTPDADPELLLTYFLNQLIYDTTNTRSGIRGHSFGRSMYGANPYGLNYAPYSGVGRIHNTYGATDPAALAGQDDYYLPSYVYYPNDGFIRDPEFYGYRNPATQATPVAANYRAGNAPYTYPDMNNMFLAQVGADGTVRAISFDRSYLNTNSKYATLYPNPTYHTSFSPVDADAGGHVRNLDFGPGTLINGTYYNNDSKWLDLGWPVMTAPNGKKYIAMFAPLITDLDNRVNMWLAGNYNGNPSNKGYGPNEINLQAQLLPIISSNTDLAALYTLRYGATPTPTYANLPAQWPQRSTAPYGDGPVYARIDFDGLNGGALTLPNPNNAKYASAQYFIWPDYPNGTYGANPPWFSPPNATTPTVAAELQGHPLGYNIFAPGGTNTKPPSASSMEAILRFMGTGAPAATSGLFKSMPQTFGNPANPYQVARPRGLLTTQSWTLDRITGAPYIPYNVTTNGNYQYNLAALPYPHPQMPTLSSPNFANAAPAGSEFTSTFNSALVSRLRVNLNRLSSSAYDYPTPDASGFIDLNQAAIATKFTIAQTARQQLARDIYNVFVAVTGAQDPNLAANAGVPTNTPPYLAARWLAQLAVNIVDYIDNDDISTPFAWYVDPNGVIATEYVFGTEAPRLVLNEAYTELDNNANDFTNNGNLIMDATMWTASTFNLNVWVELLNPFKSTPAGETYPLDSGLARVMVVPSNMNVAAYAAYEVGLSLQDASLFTLGNNRGSSAAAAKLGTSKIWGPAGTAVGVLPANGAFSDPLQKNNGFFVLGPATNFLPATAIGNTGINTPNTNPNLPMTFPSPQMSVNLNPVTQVAAINSLTANGATILLRRLACPYLPPNNTAGPTYNPYITVDFVQNIKTWDNRVANLTVNATALPGPVTTYSSIVRKEPYAASYMGTNRNPANTSAQYTANNPPAGQANNQPLNTFYRHNSVTVPPVAGNTPTFNMPFNWLVQLDRPLVNSLELLHVSAFSPHLLTQQFVPCTVVGGVVTEGAPFQHYAPWMDHAAMIFRALELLGVPSNLNGTSMGGRIPGKININTMNEAEIWQALCDANAVTNYTSADVQTIFNNLVASRTPSPNGTPGLNDAPFRSFATGWIQSGTDTVYTPGSGLVTYPNGTTANGQYPTGAGLRDTLLRKYTTKTATGQVSQPLLVVPPVGSASPALTHPYQQYQLLQKIYNNVTTTSNVFAIWITVGFFEVDDSVNPPRIGAEIGRDQNTQVRHRMFTIVDRTMMTLFTTALSGNGVTAGNGASATVAPGSGTLPNGITWSIQPGMLLEVGVPGNSEVVAVTGVNNNTNTFTANFTMSWPANTPVVCRGNPGPYLTNPATATGLPVYNHRTDPAVLYYTVIK